MIELSAERIRQILHEETAQKEEMTTILRGIYNRYMCLYERYFADIDALNDEEIAKLRDYHEETKSLVKYYYMDIPQDTVYGIRNFEETYSVWLLGPDWHKYVYDYYDEFKGKAGNESKSGEELKAEFTKHVLDGFYDVMDHIFRDDFGTDSQTARSIFDEISGLLFRSN